jgi:hypothetical protein
MSAQRNRTSRFSFLFYLFILFITGIIPFRMHAATIFIISEGKSDTLPEEIKQKEKNQTDLIDITLRLFNKKHSRNDTVGIRDTKLYVSAAPIVEYTVATGFSPGIAGNIAFKTSVIKQTNTSSLLGAVKYTLRGQLLVPLQTSYWTPGNKFNFLGDWRYLDYSQDTYGLGGHTVLADKYVITYRYLRFYEYVFKSVTKNFYAGVGYQLDYHWKIAESDIQAGQWTDFKKYGFTTSSASSGLGLAILYDTRENSINPEGGSFFTRIQFLQNSTILGSNTNWNSLVFDIRKYIRLPHHAILALWCYNYFTLHGNPPYLDLTGTGTDGYNNSGRGYEQNRYLGKNMMYAEAELRFGITRNGLLGGVVFGNAQTISEINTGRFEVIAPGFGAGLRIKFNKFSKTNACIDYGIGTGGSHGFVGNLGEVF